MVSKGVARGLIIKFRGEIGAIFYLFNKTKAIDGSSPENITILF
ncbi:MULTISPECIES: hypothetical protein [unclassified Clostridium]|nr:MULTISPECIES: hypothetical protein [unclassified Clostridium]